VWLAWVKSRYHDVVGSKQTTIRLPTELAEEAEAVARVRGTSVNSLIVDALTAEIERLRADRNFSRRAKRLLERDQQLLQRLAD
jgi:predicted DNA-binding protein